MERGYINRCYHFLVAFLALGLLFGLLIAVALMLAQGLTESFFGVDLANWVQRKLGL